MIYDGIVLAGGRSARLGGVPKSGLVFDGATLLERTVAALVGARTVIVVGGNSPGAVRESPEFGGPAAGIAAGLGALDGGAGYVIVLACDMPTAGSAVDLLLGARFIDGAILVDADGHEQYLAGIYSAAALRASVDSHRADLHGLPVRRLLDGLDIARLPGGTTTDDIDTWDDAAGFGIARPTAEGAP